MVTAALVGVGGTTKRDEFGLETTTTNSALLWSGVAVAGIGLVVGIVLRFQSDQLDWDIRPLQR